MRHDELLGRPQSDRGQRLHEQVRLVEACSAGLDPPPLQVLVVDDDRELRDLVTLALLDEGYQVVSASNGAEALQRVQRYRPDIILLDLDMPVMDGPTFAERYHALPGTHAPIVVLPRAATLKDARNGFARRRTWISLLISGRWLICFERVRAKDELSSWSSSRRASL